MGGACEEGPVVPGGLLTDLYELNVAASYLRRSMTGQATFSLFVRALPPAAGCWSPPGWRTACSSWRISPSPPMIWLPAPGPGLRGRHPARLCGLALHRGRAGGLVQRAYDRERPDHRLFSCCPAGRRGRLRRAVAPYQRQVKDRPGPGSTLSVNSTPTAPRWINSLLSERTGATVPGTGMPVPGAAVAGTPAGVVQGIARLAGGRARALC